jgi:P27 family predicted phage terminase small subunit
MGGRGSGGRNRKPTAQKKAEGNRGKRKLNLKEPPSLPGEPKKPSWLSGAPLKAWPEIVRNLAEAGTLRKTDGIRIATLCSSLILFRKADAAIAKYGALHLVLDEETGVGSFKTSAAVRVRSDALKHLRADCQAFGLDPSSGSGIQISDPDPNSRSETALDAILRSKSSKDDIVN